MAARPRQAYLVLKVFPHHIPDAQVSAKEVGSTKGTGQGRGREHLGEGRTRCRNGKYGVGMLDSWGWLTQPRLASNVCDLYSSRTVISVRKTSSSVSK